MDSNTSTETTVGHYKGSNLIRSRYKDIMVKVDDDIYYLDRIKLALESDYFEKLLTTEDFYEKGRDLIEIPLMDSETFSIIVDVMYGQNLDSLMTRDNYITLLMAMDYLQMGTGLYRFQRFIEENLRSNSVPDVFKLYHFIAENKHFQDLLPKVFQYFSEKLASLQDLVEFFTLPFHHVEQIISNEHGHPYGTREDKFQVSDICAKWICHDLENRLAHMIKLVNAAKYRLLFPDKINEGNLNVVLPIVGDEQTKRETISRCFYKLLTYDGEIDIENEDEHRDHPDSQESKPHEDEELQMHHDGENDQSKLMRYLENGNFYDITVKVGEKIYKLHRCLLEPESGYFADIFAKEQAEAVAQCEGKCPPPCPNKDREYVLDDVDQAAFDMIINSIYSEHIESHHISTSDNFVQIFKVAHILKIKTMVEDCKHNMIYFYEEKSSEFVKEILNFTRGKVEYKDVYIIYLCRHMSIAWPDINLSQIYSLPCDVFEDLLSSDKFYLDDADEILGICSKWIMHDVQNRYCLIPRITQAINCNRRINYNLHKPETPTDWNQCSEQLVRDKLWQILSSSSLLPSSTLAENTTRKFEETPVFITSHSNKVFKILNGNLDKIVSFRLPSRMEDFAFSLQYPMSATMIDDNIFIRCDIERIGVFQVYNVSLKKFFSVAADSRLKNGGANCQMLNCRNEVYCCFANGEVFRYSIRLNRWMKISKTESDKKRIFYASDGEMLYRMYNISQSDSNGSSYVVEAFNFELRLWISAPNVPLLENHSKPPITFTIINGRDLAVLFTSKFLTFDRDSLSWREISLPDEYWSTIERVYAIVTQCEDKLLHVFNSKLYSYFNQAWMLQKELPVESGLLSLSRYPYHNIIPIHKPSHMY